MLPKFGDRGARTGATTDLIAASFDKLSDNPSWVNNWRSIGEVVAALILRRQKTAATFSGRTTAGDDRARRCNPSAVGYSPEFLDELCSHALGWPS